MDAENDPLKQRIAALEAELSRLRQAAGFVPPGHFYSPIPKLAEVEADRTRIFALPGKTVPGIDMREDAQLALLKNFISFHEEQPFPEEKSEDFRYYFKNPAYSYSDALLLHFMLRQLRPARLVEIGSGFSSCMTLDTNDRFLDGRTHITFIEPYPQLLHSLMRDADRARYKIHEERLQDVDLSIFDQLQAGDILFIDSTHVAKVGSDVNHIFFEVLPRLKSGVFIHLHDVFFPFEYPESWIMQGRAWNEIYLLRTFLQFNTSFRIVLMNTFMQHFHRDFFSASLPLCLQNTGGSIWLERI